MSRNTYDESGMGPAGILDGPTGNSAEEIFNARVTIRAQVSKGKITRDEARSIRQALGIDYQI